MTEPQAGSDPKEFKCAAVQDGDDWVITGEKWFSSNFRYATFAIVMAVSDPDVPVYQGTSMMLVPTDTPGIEIIRNVGLMGEAEGEGSHAYVRYHEVRVPGDHLLGGAGQGFVIAQTRLGGGRIHHAMRTVAACKKAIDMMCERALSRESHGKTISEHQMVQEQIADSWSQYHQLRLLVLWTAWTIDNSSTQEARTQIAACKFTMAKTLRDVSYRALHIMGSLGTTNLTPIQAMYEAAPTMGIADGVDEVHKVTVARNVLKGYRPHPGLWPTEYIPAKREEAKKKYAELLANDPEMAGWADFAEKAMLRGH